MLNPVQKISKTHSKFKCNECSDEYITNHYDAKKSPVGHLCSKCKSYDGYELNQAFLQKFFLYEPNTGKLITRLPAQSRPKGIIVGSKGSHGYLMTGIQGKNYLIHRLIWLYMTGSLPEQVDHIDHDRLNNKWDNLREVNSIDNVRNTGLSKNSTTKINGVSQRKDGSYRAYIMVNRKQIHLGVFSDLGDAIQARKDADIKYGFHSNHGN